MDLQWTIAVQNIEKSRLNIWSVRKKTLPLQPISSRDGGIGRHEGLKILWPVMAVRVQVPLAVLKGKTQKHTSLLECVFGFLLLQVAQGTYAESPARGTERKGRISLSYSNGILFFLDNVLSVLEWQGCTFGRRLAVAIPPKVHSQNADYTPVNEQYFENRVTPFARQSYLPICE